MSKASPTRRTKRVVKAAVKRDVQKQSRTDVGQYAKLSDVNKAYQQLAQNQDKLGQVFNSNLTNIRTGFEMTDSWLHVQRRVLNDHVKGETHLCEDPTDGVDYEWYFRQYNAARGVTMAIETLVARAEEATRAASEDSPNLSAPPSNEFEFGGDYAHQDSSPG